MQGSGRDSLDLAHPGRVFIVTAATVLLLDQLAKWAVRSNMALNQSVPLWPNVFHLTRVHNQGAAFGLFPGGRPVFILTTALVLFVIAAYWRRVRPTQWPVVIALAFVSAGAVGNLVDRAMMGYVTDFFDFNLISFPVFNVADSAVVVGVGILMAWILFGPEQMTHQSPDSDDREFADARPADDPHQVTASADGPASEDPASPPRRVESADEGGQ